MIRIGGYDMTEKVAIAERYLVPKALRENGLWSGGQIGGGEGNEGAGEEDKQGEVPHEHLHINRPAGAAIRYSIPPATLAHLIKGWCRESGVRQLEKTIDKLTRKLAYEEVVKADGALPPATFPVTIQPEDLQKYIGKPKFIDDNMFNTTNMPSAPSLPAGVVMGLAWNPLGKLA